MDQSLYWTYWTNYAVHSMTLTVMRLKDFCFCVYENMKLLEIRKRTLATIRTLERHDWGTLNRRSFTVHNVMVTNWTVLGVNILLFFFLKNMENLLLFTKSAFLSHFLLLLILLTIIHLEIVKHRSCFTLII